MGLSLSSNMELNMKKIALGIISAVAMAASVGAYAATSNQTVNMTHTVNAPANITAKWTDQNPGQAVGAGSAVGSVTVSITGGTMTAFNKGNGLPRFYKDGSTTDYVSYSLKKNNAGISNSSNSLTGADQTSFTVSVIADQAMGAGSWAGTLPLVITYN